MTRYLPSPHYFWAGIAAVGLAALSSWFGSKWTPAFLPAALFAISAGFILFLAARPPVELHERNLTMGRRNVLWNDIRRVDRTYWVSPLVVRLTLSDDTRILLIYPGTIDSCASLLRHLRRCSREALIDGIPYRQFWRETSPVALEPRQISLPHYRLLRPEDEAEVERLYRRLKTVGRLDPNNSMDEK